ncbi:DUF4112 domain-containing protein [Aeoliella sp.]|uniref:DUF4112 domain-containing protein n=1 Tax=Aeoliella sp. TaxID=2795800 RepID=UPI003CCBA1FD
MLSPTTTSDYGEVGVWRQKKSLPATSNVVQPIDQNRLLTRLERISRLFDDAVQLPVIPVRLGWDAVLGLIPVVGDAATTAVSAYFVWEAHRLGARKRTLLRMLANVGIDFLVGTVPLVGDLLDIGWRANRKNMRVLVRELERQGKVPAGYAQQRIDTLLQRTKRRTSQRSHTRLPQWFPLLMP